MLIRALEKSDHNEWLALYYAYADYYQTTLTDEGHAATWGWLVDVANPVSGFVAVHENQLIGFAHFRAMPSPLRGRDVGFLDDLFVSPDARGMNTAAALIDAVKHEAKRQNWDVVRWITRDNNYRARGLYDRVAVKTDWNTYELKP